MASFVLPVTIQKFTTMIRKKPAIWNVHSNKFARQESWQEILIELYPDYSTWVSKRRMNYFKKVVKKWTTLRDSYVKSEKKQLSITEEERERHRPYIHSEHLTFLRPVLNTIKRAKTSQKSDTTDSENDSDHEIESETPEENIPHIKVEDLQTEPVEQVNVRRKRSYSHSSDDSPNVKVRMTEPSTSTLIDSAETHMSFFRGIIPSLETFDVDQVLEFQIGVLKLVKQIRNNNRYIIDSPTAGQMHPQR